MKSALQLIVIFILCTVIHWAFAAFGSSFNISINFMLTVCVIVCARYNKWAGYTFAFFGGMFLDFFGVNMFGAYALTFTLCAGIVYLVKKLLDFESVLPQMVLIFCITIISVLLYNFTGLIFSKGTAWHGFQSLVFGAVSNSIIALFVFSTFNALSLPEAESFV
ncbi:rod shape-determining protein MreD [Elusimicrobium simillimum]|uniref:rod shape-determining protein MreD n=1 Tax=Elusimicrobium simillimum TaxID=3143438 RepID=UPI003C6FDABB